MNKNIDLITKFQKDFERYLDLYSIFLVDGNISDKQAFYKDGELFTPLFPYYLTNVYGNEYAIYVYDSDKVEQKRFTLLNNDKKILESKSVKFFNTLVGIEKFDESSNDNSNNNETPTDGENGPQLPKSEEEIEDLLTVSHSNNGISLDLSKIHYALNTALDIPFIFIFTNTSRFGLQPGVVNNAEEQKLYNAIFKLTENTTHASKIVFLTNKSNDLPAWIENEEINLNVKKLTILKPDEELRKLVVLELIKNTESELLAPYRDVENLSKELDRTLEKVVASLSGYTITKIEKLFDFIETDEEILEKYTLEDIDKILLKFNFGTNISNPWDRDSIFDSITKLSEEVSKDIIGQDDALEAIQSILGLAVTGFNRISNPKAPRAVLFLAGPTGTGKTEVTKKIAKMIFNSEDKIIRFDMSEFAQEHTDQRLFGAPPGYVGYNAGGELTNAVTQNPFSLILFDEIEKAHPRILDKFLQILSDGRLTDGQGKTVSFENTIIVMTSNKGISLEREKITDKNGIEHEVINPNLNTLFIKNNVDYRLAELDVLVGIEEGKDFSTDNIPMKTIKDYYEHLKRFVKCNLSYFFEFVLNRKEIYGRLYDSVVVYNYICKEAAEGIIRKQMRKVNNTAAQLGLNVDTEHENYQKVFEYVCRFSNTNEVRGLGGRGIIKNVDKVYGTAISNKIIETQKNKFDNVTVTFDIVDDKIKVNFIKNK